jgi:hypothetical protein
MFIALLVQEFTTALAMNQFLDNLRFQRGDRSLSQASFVRCGGLRYRDGDNIPHAITIKQYYGLSITGIDLISESLPSAEDLPDKSKSDQLTKGLAILQTAWFIGQCSQEQIAV